jgi:acetyl-CoA carboxylase carboxyltransferase component
LGYTGGQGSKKQAWRWKRTLKKLEEKGKLSARKRINLLVDNPDEVLEIGVLAAENMYSEYGGCPSAGVVVVIGKISG